MVSHAAEYAHPSWSGYPASSSSAKPIPIPSARPSTATSSKSNTSISASNSTAARRALQEKYTTEQVFCMYKDYKFSGKIASVGMEGPNREDLQAASNASLAMDAKNKKTKEKSRVGKQDIWTDEAEFAFLAGKRYTSRHLR